MRHVIGLATTVLLLAYCAPTAGADETRHPGFALDAKPRQLAHGQPVTAIAIAPDGATVATGADGSVKLWDTQAGREMSALDAGGEVTALAFAPDGSQLAAACGDGAVRVWDLRRPNALPRELRGHTHAVLAVAFTPDGRTIASGGIDKAVSFYDAAAGTLRHRVQSHRARPGQHPDAGATRSLAFSPDGSTLVSAHAPAGPSLRVWDARRMVELFDLGREEDGAQSATFSPDGATLAAADRAGRSIVLWETATWRPRGTIDLPPSSRVPLAFSPDGWNIVTGSADGLTVWDLATAAPATQHPAAHRARLACLAFSPDARTLVTGGDDGSASVWRLTPAPRPAAAEALGRSSLERLWGTLADEDGRGAYAAVWALAASPAESVPYVAAWLPQAQPASDADVRRLIRELDDERFLVRERATRQLGQLGEAAEPLLREHAAAPASPEAMQRIEVLLDGLTLQGTDADVLRGIRAIEVLERAGTPQAREILRTVASGAYGARLKARAVASLRRLDLLDGTHRY